MEHVESWIWLFSVGLFFFGMAAGFALGRANDNAWKRNQDLEKAIDETSKEYQTYRSEVTQHFATTAHLFNHLSQSYRSIFEHFAHSSHQLCGAPLAQALDFDKQKELVANAEAEILRLSKDNKSTTPNAQKVFVQNTTDEASAHQSPHDHSQQHANEKLAKMATQQKLAGEPEPFDLGNSSNDESAADDASPKSIPNSAARQLDQDIAFSSAEAVTVDDASSRERPLANDEHAQLEGPPEPLEGPPEKIVAAKISTEVEPAVALRESSAESVSSNKNTSTHEVLQLKTEDKPVKRTAGKRRATANKSAVGTTPKQANLKKRAAKTTATKNEPNESKNADSEEWLPGKFKPFTV